MGTSSIYSVVEKKTAVNKNLVFVKCNIGKGLFLCYIYIGDENNMTHKKNAFTLTELVAAVAIIGLLSAIMIPKVMTGIDKARVASVVTDTRNIRNAAYAMYADTGLWPGSNWHDDTGADPLATPTDCADGGEGFVFKGNNTNMPNTWAGPYLEVWHRNPWGGWYWWDFNLDDQNGDGVGYEHVLWIDNGCDTCSNTGHRIPAKMRLKIDQVLDDGNLDTGMLQVWQNRFDYVNGNLGYILVQGFN
jgi:prepilin-type N-terminal cleavage/methylation domain-containing protein